MTNRHLFLLTIVLLSSSKITVANGLPDIRSVPQDLKTPMLEETSPAAGKRVKVIADEYKETEVYHSLYLPIDWNRGKKFPVIVEYAGNGPYKNSYGDICTGKVEDCNLGFGISGGKGFIWVCLPYISKDGKQNQLQWWGDVQATVDYCKKVVPNICKKYRGNPQEIFLTGFSRGAIACNFIGLHDDEIAKLWRGFICHSHYDGVIQWNYAGSDKASAVVRLKRLKNRPQFISHEGSVAQTQKYLLKAYPQGNFTFQTIPYRNHTDAWVLRDFPARAALRRWLADVLNNKEASTARP